jgi:4'-phosphopantetheinyl transferase EntD
LWTIRIFSAKEAVFKAQYPLTGAMIDFHGAEIAFTDGGFAATLTAPTGDFPSGHVITGRQQTVRDHVLSSVMIRT